MVHYWLLKTEPGDYSFADLERDGTTVWDGVRNAAALKHMRSMQPGDQALIYHTGKERQAVGLAEITTPPYADPHTPADAGTTPPVVVELRAIRRLPAPVSLAAIKADPAFADCALVRQGRLSVVPVPPELWQRLVQMATLV